MTTPDQTTDFSFVKGGPFYRLLGKCHLTDADLERRRRRMIVLALLAWLPLLVLSALGGRAWSGGVTVPFLLDVEAHVRFLIVVPLLLAAELDVHRRLAVAVRQFVERDLIPESERERFHAAIASAGRWSRSTVAEVLLLVFTYVVGVGVIWLGHTALPTATWYADPDAGKHLKLTTAGLWFAFVSLPAFHFLVWRWYYRLGLWVRFLWQVSRIRLGLIPTHPDRAAGLGFLSGSTSAFTLLVIAHGALLAGLIANRILHTGASLLDFKFEIAGLTVFVLCAVLAPLFLFTPQLVRARRTGNREYGILAQRYVREFDAKWLRGGAAADEPLVGSADVQSLADMGNSFEVLKTMSIVPVRKSAVLHLAFAALFPIAPLALTMMSLEELLRRLSGIFF